MYLYCDGFNIHTTGNDFNVLALPVTITGFNRDNNKSISITVDLFNLPLLKAHIEGFLKPYDMPAKEVYEYIKEHDSHG